MATIDSVKLPDNSTYDLTDNYSGYQKQTLTTPLTINGTQETNVEGALGGLNDYSDVLKTTISNENLLNNPWFTINQRGNTSFSSAGYTVDGWAKEASGGGTLTLTSDGMQFPASATGGNFYQNFESGKFLNKVITITLKYSDGSFAKGTLTYTTPATTVINDGKMKVYLYDDTILLQHNSTDATARTIRAIKLELGTVSTLANDIEPNKNVEIIKCQNPLRVVGTPNVYRGQEITLNADFWAHISDGTFENQQVGDTLTINGRTYTLAHANYWLHTGNIECTANHWVVISPDMGNAKMNSDNSTTGGYLGSGFRSGTNHDSTPNTALADALAIIKTDFGASHILSHREYLDNAVTGGYPSAGTWVDSEAELMTQIMVYGNRFYDPSTNLGSTFPTLFSVGNSQLALYAQRPDLLATRSYWWLRDVASATYFACHGTSGVADLYEATHSFGVRLAFGIIA